MKVSRLISRITNYLLDVRCILCLQTTNLPISLCEECRDDLPQLSLTCRLCADHLPNANHDVCGRCLLTPPAYENLYIPYSYANALPFLISQLKFSQQLIPAHILGFLLSQFLLPIYAEGNLPDLIIPIPLHSKRLKERGFNQALEIARPLGRQLGIPICVRSSMRTKFTHPQSSLTGKDRFNNVKHAFTISPTLKNKYVAVIDDVMTTGQTIESFCIALKAAGVAKIDVWVVAKTSKNHL